MRMISRRLCFAIALCGIATPSMAAGLLQALPDLWVSATALSLTLVTAAGTSKK